MPKTLVAAPGSEPLMLEEAKEWLRIDADQTGHDGLILGLITAARIEAESFLERALVTQTWDYFRDNFEDEMEIPLPKLQSITSIKYIDSDGVQQTLSSSVYSVDTAAEPGLVRLAYGQSWPSVRGQANAVTIRFVAGYGTPEDAPETIKLALKMMVANSYETPGAALSEQAKALLWPYRILRFA